MFEARLRRLVGHHRRAAVHQDPGRGALDHRRFWDAMDASRWSSCAVEPGSAVRMVAEFGLDLPGWCWT